MNCEVQHSPAIPVGSVKATDKIVTVEGLSIASSHPVQKNWADWFGWVFLTAFRRKG